MLRTTRLLNLRRLRRQRLRAVIAVAAVASGVAMGVAVLILSGSTDASLHQVNRTLAGPAALRVVGATSRGGIAPGVLGTVEHTPGVDAAVPVVQAVTYVQDARGRNTAVLAFGVDCRVELLLGPIGCNPADVARRTVASPPLTSTAQAARLGPGGELRTDLGRTSMKDAPTASPLNRVNRGNVVVVPLTVAQQAFGRGDRFDAIYVALTPGARLADVRARLQRAVGDWNGVLLAGDPPPGAGAVSGAFLPVFGLLASFALGVGAVLIFNTMSLSLEDRRRELAVVGALGGPPRVIVAGTMVEAAALGLVGGVVGVAAAVVVAHPLTASVSDFTTKFAAIPITVHVNALSAVVGVLLGVVVATAAAWVPVRRAVRMDVAAELSLREARAESAPAATFRRLAWTASVVAAGLGVCWVAQRHGAIEPWQAAAGPLGVAVTSIGCLLVTGALAALAASGLHALGRGRTRGPLRLALANAVREPGRTAVMAVAVGAAMATGIIVQSAHRSIHDAIEYGVSHGNPRQVQVSALGDVNTLNVEAKLPPALIARLATVPGALRVDENQAVLTGHDDRSLIGVSAYDHPWLDYSVAVGHVDRGRFEAGEVVIGPALARARRVRPGGTVTVATPTGDVRLKVQAVVYDGNFNGRVVDMPMSLFRRLYGDQPAGAVGVIADASTPPDVLAARIRALHLDRDLTAVTPQELIARTSREFGQQLQVFYALQQVLLAVAFVAVLSTLLLVGSRRKRELGMLAAIAMEPRQLADMTVSEAVVVGLLGIAVSVIGAAGMNVAFGLVLPIIVGFKDPLRFDFTPVLTAGPVALLVVAGAAVLPAMRTARVKVLEALQYE